MIASRSNNTTNKHSIPRVIFFKSISENIILGSLILHSLMNDPASTKKGFEVTFKTM